MTWRVGELGIACPALDNLQGVFAFRVFGNGPFFSGKIDAGRKVEVNGKSRDRRKSLRLVERRDAPVSAGSR